jgi:hypothetical protein
VNHYACVSCGRPADDCLCVGCAPEQAVESGPSPVRPYVRLDNAATPVQDTIEQTPRVAATGRHRIRDSWLPDESWSPISNTGTMDRPDDATVPRSAPTRSSMLGLIESTLHRHRAAVGITVAATILAGAFVSMANDRPESSSPARVGDPLSVTSDNPGAIHVAPQSSVAQMSPLPSSAVGVPASGVAGPVNGGDAPSSNAPAGGSSMGPSGGPGPTAPAPSQPSWTTQPAWGWPNQQPSWPWWHR